MNFVPRRLPWLLAAAMLLIYGLTLNHWVSLLNLPSVAKISGWTWQPEVLNPITFLVTGPLRLLPASAVPLALNLFSAVCAALALGLLARSVALLPHDRTDAQRRREGSDFSFLTTGSAWLPPLLAVLVCGLQLTFWERATNWTGEMFDLLLFAVVVWSLLEYRLDEREWRLYVAAFIYAAGMTDDWGMTGFFPLFLVAIVWLRGFDFFNRRFLGRMTLCGLAGLSFYLLLPLLAVAAHKMPFTFSQYVKFNLSPQYGVLKTYFAFGLHPQQYLQTLSLLLAYLMPLFVLAIRWKSSFGDTSQIGVTLASFVFHVLHAVFLAGCLWLLFDPPFSPRHAGFGLMFYYLMALSVGYYSGYFLLIFGKRIARQRDRQPGAFQWLNPLVVAGVWLLGLVAVAGLGYRNAPQIRGTNGDPSFRRYLSLIEEQLPAAGGYVLSDDPQQLALVHAALLRDGRARNFVPLETQSLVVPAYHRYLHRKFPQGWPELVSATQTNLLNPMGLIQVLAHLARTNDFDMARTNLYYLHPSSGYYFEQFYLEPHGIVYRMVTLPEDTLLPPLPDKNLIAENESFWARTAAQEYAPIELAAAPAANTKRSWGERWLAKFHVPREPDRTAVLAGAYYSRSLDFWGVELQRAGELEKATARFDDALKLNPDNAVGRINLGFNQTLRRGGAAPVDLSKTSSDQLGKYQTWSEVMNAGGPFDEPSFCFAVGLNLAAGNGYFRQAVASFDRVRQLDPDNLQARFWLGQIYIMNRLPERALAALREPLTHPEKFSLVETNETQLHVLAAAAYFAETNFTRAAELLDAEIARHPDDNNLLASTAQAYLVRGLFDKALGVINRRLQLVPDDPAWLYSKGYVSIQLKNYDTAVAALSRVLLVQTNNENALFNRAIANLDSGRLGAARADYLRLQQTYSNAFQIAYGLGEIAWRQRDTNEAVRNFRIYLANADTNSGEARTVLERLRELQK
jgi:tetratricopeptide (TPR) repeat protein